MNRSKAYISVDIEAALIRGRQYIIEIGAVKWLPDGTKETFTQLIQPYKFKKLNYHIQKLTGIKTEDLLDAPTFKEAFYKFKHWCGTNYAFLTFGEFDRKVLEEEFARNYLNPKFLYPIIDFQQKYMIANKLKEQPSLGGLMAQLELEVETQHRALADADSLLRIFEAVNGVELIEEQKTNELILVLTHFKQLETTFDLVINKTICKIENGQLNVANMETFREQLPFEIKESEKVNAEGEKEIVQTTKITSSKNATEFLKGISVEMDGKIILTRTALRSISRILKLHNVTLPKTEVMTLLNLFNNNEDMLGRFSIGEENVEAYEAKISRLLTKYEQMIIDEFKKRDLLPAIQLNK